MTETAKWAAYLQRLLDVGKFRTSEFEAVADRFWATLRYEKESWVESLSRSEWEAILKLHTPHPNRPYLRGGVYFVTENIYRSVSPHLHRRRKRRCKRCSLPWESDNTDPNRCASCFAPAHESQRILDDEIDEHLTTCS